MWLSCKWLEKGKRYSNFQEGYKTSPCNYKPVSLTSQVCKILEFIVKDNMSEHIKRFGLIKETQHMVLLKIGHA